MSLDETNPSEAAPHVESDESTDPTAVKGATGVTAISPTVCRLVVGRRFASARKLAGLDQLGAAAQLGYQNSSQLSKIESGQSGAAVYIIQRAAIVYGVSMDYLTGLSDYPERDAATCEQLAIMRSLRQQIWDATQAKLKELVVAGENTVALMGHIGRQRNSIGDTWRELCSFERSFDVGLEGGFADVLPEESRHELVRRVRRHFAESLKGLKAALETSVGTAEHANRYLRRRQAVRAHEYLDDVEQGYPLLGVTQGGLLGALEALQTPEPEPTA